MTSFPTTVVSFSGEPLKEFYRWVVGIDKNVSRASALLDARSAVLTLSVVSYAGLCLCGPHVAVGPNTENLETINQRAN